MKVEDGKLPLAHTRNISELNTTGADEFAADEAINSLAVNEDAHRVGFPSLANEYANEQNGNAGMSSGKAVLLEQYRALLAEREASVAENAQYQRMLAKYYNDQRQRKGQEGGSDGDAHLLTTP